MNRIPDGSVVKYLPANAGDMESIPEQEDSLEEEMATFSSILARKTPWTEEPGGLQSAGRQRVRHNWATDYTNKQNTEGVTETVCGLQSLKYLLTLVEIYLEPQFHILYWPMTSFLRQLAGLGISPMSMEQRFSVSEQMKKKCHRSEKGIKPTDDRVVRLSLILISISNPIWISRELCITFAW